MRSATRFAFAAALAVPFAAQAQAWKQGMPDKMKESKLAPHAGKMTETPPGEIPVGKLKAPQGFKVELWASGLPGGRAPRLLDHPGSGRDGAGVDALSVVRDDDVVTVTLTRPERRNVLGRDVIAALTDAFADAGRGDALAVVLAAEGPTFSAGHDFADMDGVDLAAARGGVARPVTRRRLPITDCC